MGDSPIIRSKRTKMSLCQADGDSLSLLQPVLCLTCRPIESAKFERKRLHVIQPILLGRGPEKPSDTNGSFMSLAVSRKHAKITFWKGSFYVTDIGSSNGTFVNDEKLSKDDRKKLCCGDILKLGELVGSGQMKEPKIKPICCYVELDPCDRFHQDHNTQVEDSLAVTGERVDVSPGVAGEQSVEKQEEGKGGDVIHEEAGGGGGDTQDIDTLLEEAERVGHSEEVLKILRQTKADQDRGIYKGGTIFGGN